MADRAPEYISRAIHRAHVLFRKKLRNPYLSTEYTDPDMARKAAAFALHLGKRPLPVNSSPGFLVNRVLLPCLLEAGIIFGTGFAPFRGGPLHYVHAQGSEILQKCLHGLEYRYGKHFHASNGWGAVG